MIQSSMIACIITMVLGMIFMSMKEKSSTNSKAEKESFECGFMSTNSMKMAFSTNFIMMIMLFLVFDVEVSIMIPMIMTENNMKENFGMTAKLFVTILTVLLMKEWMVGAMEWNK